MPILKMINWDICDFNGNLSLWFKQDFDSCKLLSFGHDSYFQRNVAGLLLSDCWNEMPCHNNATLKQLLKKGSVVVDINV